MNTQEGGEDRILFFKDQITDGHDPMPRPGLTDRMIDLAIHTGNDTRLTPDPVIFSGQHIAEGKYIPPQGHYANMASLIDRQAE